MKKLLGGTICIVLLLSLFACGSKESNAGNVFPVETKTFESVTAEYDSMLAVNEVSMSSTKSQHNIFYQEYPDMEIAGITTGINDGIKILNMTFGAGAGSSTILEAEPYKSKMVTTENVKETLVYTAKLYGFEDENSIYDAFSKGNMDEKDAGTGYKSYTWVGKVDGADCKVVFNEPYGSGVKVLFSISITSK